MGTSQTRWIGKGLFSHRYEEEVNKRTAVENDFVLLKKVKDPPPPPAQGLLKQSGLKVEGKHEFSSAKLRVSCRPCG